MTDMQSPQSPMFDGHYRDLSHVTPYSKNLVRMIIIVGCITSTLYKSFSPELGTFYFADGPHGWRTEYADSGQSVYRYADGDGMAVHAAVYAGTVEKDLYGDLLKDKHPVFLILHM